MYGLEIIDDRVREIRAEVNRAAVNRRHRSVAERLRALAHRAERSN